MIVALIFFILGLISYYKCDQVNKEMDQQDQSLDYQKVYVDEDWRGRKQSIRDNQFPQG